MTAMIESERGEQTFEGSERPDSEQTGRRRRGDAAGGDRRDVPGGTYNVSPEMAEKIRERPAERGPRRRSGD
jgi:hypothetical protein